MIIPHTPVVVHRWAVASRRAHLHTACASERNEREKTNFTFITFDYFLIRIKMEYQYSYYRTVRTCIVRLRRSAGYQCMVDMVAAAELENYSQMNFDSIIADTSTLPCNLYAPREYYILTRPGENIATHGRKETHGTADAIEFDFSVRLSAVLQWIHYTLRSNERDKLMPTKQKKKKTELSYAAGSHMQMERMVTVSHP